MGTNQIGPGARQPGARRPGAQQPDPRAYAETLPQVEPEEESEVKPHPFSLMPAELGRLPATMATEPISVFAWVRYPAVSIHIQGIALAWTQTAVYIEWEHRGVHRAWVWANAVQRGGLDG